MTSTIVVFPLHYLLTDKQTGSAQMPAARVSAMRGIVPASGAGASVPVTRRENLHLGQHRG